jgi:hypothetical protein
MTTTYYKLTAKGARSMHGGDLTWPQPRGSRPGKWVEVTGDIALCQHGLHAVKAKNILDWSCEEVWEVELGGLIRSGFAKVVASRARLLRLAMDESALRHFAVSCAARVLPLFEREQPTDLRVRECLIACGPMSTAAARDASWDVAWDIAGAAARDAAEAAPRAAAGAAAGAAWAAARDAAWAAGAAEGYASWDAERRWQLTLLRQYLAGTVNLDKPVKLPPRPQAT